MPHIHTEPGQHDITASAWIIRYDNDVPKVLVHMHRKFGKLMQVGGHIELDETPWQTLAHELKEESGYDIKDLRVLQPSGEPVSIHNAAVHPVPVLSNTHKIPGEHFHTDLCYAFVADDAPSEQPAEGESTDLRWLSLDELKQAVADGHALADILEIYTVIVERFLPKYYQIEAGVYTLGKPENVSL